MTNSPVTEASADFKLSITRALADQLLSRLRDLTAAPLTTENVSTLQQRPGVYELFLEYEATAADNIATGETASDDTKVRRVYVGKADKDLTERLEQHRRKLSGRSGISLNEVFFKCLYVDEDLDAAAPEKLLQRRYGRATLPWNTNGFGNKDPGRKRDDSKVKKNHFDALYPANIDLPIDDGILTPGEQTVGELLQTVKPSLPFNLRFKKESKVLTGHTVDVPEPPLTVRQVISLAIEAMPEEWQATALPGYVILYPEQFDYESARYIWHKVDGEVSERLGDNILADSGEVVEDDDHSAEESGEDE